MNLKITKGRKSMRTKRRNKFLAILFTLAMVIGMFPMASLAAGPVNCEETDCQHSAAVIVEDTVTHYDTLEEAVLEAPENATVHLLKNVTMNSQLTINKKIILDGKNDASVFTVTRENGSGDAAILVTKNGATLQNLAVVGPNTTEDTWDSGEYGIKVYCASGVTLENITVSGANAGVLVSSSEATLKGAITVSGNEFGGIEVCRASSSRIPGRLNLAEGAEIVCEDTAAPAIWVDKAADAGGTVIINEEELPALYVNADSKDQIYYVTDQTVIDAFVEAAGGAIIAKSNGIQFTSLEDAIALARDGDTITIQDETIKTVTMPTDKEIAFEKNNGALDVAEFGNNGYPYGTQLKKEQNIVLAIDVTDAENTYQWQSAAAKDGAYNDIATATESTLCFTPVDKNWYRCVVNGVPGNAIQLLSISQSMMDGCEVLNSSFTNYWYISNGTIAYTVDKDNSGKYTAFDVVGKYTKTTNSDSTTYWLNTTYSGDGWQLVTNLEAQPESEKYYYDGSSDLDALRFSFDVKDKNALHMEADLAAGQQSFAFGADVELGDYEVTGYSDTASLKAIYKSGKVSAIQMVGALSTADAVETDPAFVLKLEKQTPSAYWIGEYDDRTLWAHHEGQQRSVDAYIAELTDGAYTTFDAYFAYEKEDRIANFKEEYAYENPTATEAEIQAALDADIAEEGGWDAIKDAMYRRAEQAANGGLFFTDGIVSEVRDVDSGMTASWMNLPDGGAVQFDFCVGSVKETGAEITVDAVPSTNSITVNESKVDLYYAVFDKNGNQIGDWTEGNGDTLTFSQNIKDGTTYVIKAVKKTEFDVAINQPKPGAEVGEFEVTTQSKSSGNGGTVTYSIAVEKTENGKVSANKTYASAGSEITLTVLPEENYKLAAVTATDSKGNEIAVTKNSNGTYSFKMPSSNVTVKAEFLKIDSVADCTGDKTCPAYPFTDLDLSKWYHDGIHYCVENSLMRGISDTIFAPNTATTRGMLVTILYRLEGEPTVSGDDPFSDVNTGSWYENAVTWAASNKIVEGYVGKYNPEGAVTREQMATILYRYAEYKGYDVTGKADLSKFTDSDEISTWAKDALSWANVNGLVEGNGSKLMPRGNAERCQTAAILMRFCQNAAK